MKTFTIMLGVVAALFLVALMYLSPMIESGVQRVNAQALEEVAR